MFIWDFTASSILEQITDWIFAKLVGFLGEFFANLGNMGAEIFDMNWVRAIVLFFSYLAWALFLVGVIVAVFECAIEYQSGRGNIKDVALNIIKGFFAVSLFSVLPVELYKLSISLQNTFVSEISLIEGTINGVGGLAMEKLSFITSIPNISVTIGIFYAFLMGYSIIKVFFANLKRGGILLIQIAVGSLYVFGIPRGNVDGFIGWSKQIIALCFTAFMQTIVLIAGLMMCSDNVLLGIGVMLATSEIPRIAGAFGLDTTTRANISSAIRSAQTAVTLVQKIAK